MQNSSEININQYFQIQDPGLFLNLDRKLTQYSYFNIEDQFQNSFQIDFVCQDQLMEFNNTNNIYFQANQIKSDYIQQSQIHSLQVLVEKSEDQVQQKLSDKYRKVQKEKKSMKKKIYKPKAFYEKNICRNIIRKAIRAIESEIYEKQIENFCLNQQIDSDKFKIIMGKKIEKISGPLALKEFFKINTSVERVFKNFLKWYLKERYIREAIKDGHMSNIKKYIEFKNTMILPLL